LLAVSATGAKLADMPEFGRLARFSVPVLQDLRFYPVARPFQKHLIFYRHHEAALYLERSIHGARDLPRRLAQPPPSEGH
jgi:toxin ParE1/3/4